MKTQGSNLDPEFIIHTGGGATVGNSSNIPANTGRLYYWGNGADRKNVLEFQISDNSTLSNWVFHCGAKTDEAKSRYFAVNGAVECTTVSQSSDRDLKDNIEVIPNAVEAIRKMKGYTYTLKRMVCLTQGNCSRSYGSITRSGWVFRAKERGSRAYSRRHPLMTEERFYNVDYAAVTGLLVQVCRSRTIK